MDVVVKQSNHWKGVREAKADVETIYHFPPYSPEWMLEAEKKLKTTIHIPPRSPVERSVRAECLVKTILKLPSTPYKGDMI